MVSMMRTRSLTRQLRTCMSGVAVVATLQGCAMSQEQRDQMFGALAGAAGGAAIGALATGGDTEAMVAGAAAGALVGWGAVKLSQYHAERTRSAEQEAKAYGYRPAEGTVVKIRAAESDPEKVRPGEMVTFRTDYALLAPDAGSVTVRESWALSKDGSVLSKMPPKEQKREPGGWQARASIDAPENAENGTYVVTHRIEAGSSYDERIATFVIQR